jgi:hypothetical protein
MKNNRRPSSILLRFLRLSIALVISFSSVNAQAGLFGEKEAIKTISSDAALGLDGILTLDFAWRSDLGFDAKKLNIVLTYAPLQPEVKNIRTITTKSCSSNPRLPIGGSCSKYTRPLEYSFSVLAS